METISIYALFDPRDNQPKYIGKTKNIKRRFNEHLKEKGKYKKITWINKLLRLDMLPIMEVIDVVFKTEEDFWEKYWISQFKTWGFELLNHTEGGHNPPIVRKFGLENSFHIPEVKKKIDEMNRARKGKTFEEIYGINQANKIKAAASKKFKGIGNPNHKGEVLQYSKTGNLIKVWPDSKTAAKELDIDASNITRCIAGQYKQANGFIWRRKEK